MKMMMTMTMVNGDGKERPLVLDYVAPITENNDLRPDNLGWTNEKVRRRTTYLSGRCVSRAADEIE